MNYNIDINDELNLDKYIDLFNSKQSFILDTNKKSLCSIETLVKEIALIHLTRLFTDFSSETMSEIYTIEFHLSTNMNDFESTSSKQTYVDINNKSYNDLHSHMQRKQIITSSITFFDSVENNCDTSCSFTSIVNPEVFCLIDSEKYKYKYYDDKIVLFIFPKKGKHVYFDEEMFCNGTYNYCQDTVKNICLYVRIWKQCVPLNSIQFNGEKYMDCITDKTNNVNICNDHCMIIYMNNQNKLIEFPLLKITNNLTDNVQYFYNLISKVNLQYTDLFKSMDDLMPEEDHIDTVIDVDESHNSFIISVNLPTNISTQSCPSSFCFYYKNDKNVNDNNNNTPIKKISKTTKYDTFYNYHFFDVDNIAYVNKYMDFDKFESLWVESQYFEILSEISPKLFDCFFTIFNIIINEIFVANLLYNNCTNVVLQNMYIVKNNIDKFYILLKKKGATICCILLTNTIRFDDFKICFTDKTFTYLQSGHLLICSIDSVESMNVPTYDFIMVFIVFAS